MQPWYYNIPSGIYTTKQIMNVSNPPQSYQCVYSALKRLGVKNFRKNKKKVPYNKKNEMYWDWKGALFYLDQRDAIK